MELLYKLLICHFVGDYVLQNDFLASYRITSVLTVNGKKLKGDIKE